jgi:hypothetical protein
MDPRQQIIVTKRYCGGSVTCFVFMEENQILMTGGGIIFKRIFPRLLTVSWTFLL